MPRVYFFPFTDTAEYQIKPPKNFARTPDEEKLRAVRILGGVREELPLTDAQVYWRRKRSEEFLSKGDPEALGREFPISPAEAFRAASTDAYYPVDLLQALLNEAPPPVVVHEEGYNGMGGRIEIWELPHGQGEEDQPEVPAGVGCVIGADESEGIQDGRHDNCAADAFREDTREQVFCYHGCPDGDHFAYDLDGLSSYYDGAMLVPERLLGGGACVNRLIELGANLYRHETGTEGAPERTKFGFPAQAKNLRDGKLLGCLARANLVWQKWKGEGMTATAACLEAGAPVIRSKITLRELLRYSKLEGGKRGGKGSNDDHCSSTAIATYYMETFPPTWQQAWGEEGGEYRPPYAIGERRRV